MTPKERAAMQQALEALEELHYSSGTVVAARMYVSATAALREALAEQAEQEPVAWNDLDDHELAEKLGWRIGDPLYMTAVGLGQEAIHHFKAKNTAPVRTKDPCHPWQDLTDDEIEGVMTDEMMIGYTEIDHLAFARAVIAADRSKNGII